MDFILEHGWLILFVIWGLPLTYYRSRFRKMVYQTDHWLINIQPKFIREVKALFGYYHVENSNFIKQRNFYRFYLAIYLILFCCYLYFK
jgi:peroxiredoxin Q/BCP